MTNGMKDASSRELGVNEDVEGKGYLSFVSKCVSNPVSCVALGESDPLLSPVTLQFLSVF